jgi:DMSO/TMAO reductase YedYZ molybdopterin-dependent catalytic subunit
VGHAQGASSKDRLIVRSARPQDLETPVSLLDSWITPIPLFYVRSHFYTPSLDAGAWRLRIDGGVSRVLELSLDDLRKRPSVTMPVTLECAGNGRAFFDPPVAGVQWEKGAVGTARWTGVRLADLLADAGVAAAARYVWLDGGDRGTGRAPDFIRSLPLAKAMHRDTLLAYAMNGEPLPVEHGFPLRAIVPGWEGAYSVKWLTHVEVSDVDHPGAFVQTAYRYPRQPGPPGVIPAPADMMPVQGLPVKSLITSPAGGAALVPGAPVRIAGFAWAGDEEVARVEVSTDDGRTWTEARLGDERAPYAWRAFEYVWQQPQPGARVVASRATDGRGRTQPALAAWNPSGYLWNSVDRVHVNVGGAAVVQARCSACHDGRLIEQQRLTRDGWRREVEKMMGWGAPVTEGEKDLLIDYLSSRWSP